MQLPSHLWQLHGAAPGPNVVVLGGTHGDELSGIEAVRFLLSRLGLLQHAPGIYPREDIQGNVFLGFGNPEAMLRGTRSASAGTDLNRSFVPNLENIPATSDETPDCRRARELLPLFVGTNFLLDLHGTSSPSEPFICFGTVTPKRRELCRLFPVRYVFTDPDVLYFRSEGFDYFPTTDEAVARHGGVSLAYETGLGADGTVAKKVASETLRFLAHSGAALPEFLRLFTDLPAPANPDEQEIHAVRVAVVAKHDGFTYAEGMARGWQQVVKGQLIGRYLNGEQEYVPRDGRYVFPTGSARIRRDRLLVTITERVD